MEPYLQQAAPKWKYAKITSYTISTAVWGKDEWDCRNWGALHCPESKLPPTGLAANMYAQDYGLNTYLSAFVYGKSTNQPKDYWLYYKFSKQPGSLSKVMLLGDSPLSYWRFHTTSLDYLVHNRSANYLFCDFHVDKIKGMVPAFGWSIADNYPWKQWKP